MLSTRVDLVDRAIIDEIEKLQDSVPPFPHEEALAVMSAAWGVPPSLVCDWLDDEPVASASLGQVYKATLKGKYGSRQVAIKVLRPGVRRCWP